MSTQTALKAWKTRRVRAAFKKARTAEAASKKALRSHCKRRGWRVAFFEGATGSPRTGIVDAIAFRIDRHKADQLDIRLIQLKGGRAGASGREIARLKQAAIDARAKLDWLIVAFDGEALHFLPGDLK